MASTPLVVRPAQPAEAADVAWLAALTFPLACPPGTSRQSIAAHVAHRLTPAQFRDWATSPSHALLVAVDGAEPAAPRPAVLGYALVQLGLPDGSAEAEVLREATGGDGPYVELSKIYAHPQQLGTGVASALMAGAVEAAAALAVAQGHADGLPLWLGTNGQNARAQAFYRKHGFAVVGRRTYLVGGVAHDDVVMVHAARR